MPQAEKAIPYTFNDCMDVVRSLQGYYPVKTIPIAEALGLKVYKVPGWHVDRISGQLLKLAENGGASGHAIFVNEDHAQQRRRFTIAHEIAHFVLHRDQINGGIEDNGLYHSRLGAKADRQANLFAINEILIPEFLLDRAQLDALGEHEHLTIPILAKIFDVPNSLMSIKMGIPHEVGAQQKDGG